MPSFPFRRSVGQDLRDLFGHDRIKDQERGLGYSSISPGEGSAEVRGAGGNTLAHFGHAAGKSGFLVPDGASWQTVQEAIAAGTTALEGRMDTAEGRLDDHAARIGAVEGVNSTQNGRLDDHASRIGALEGASGPSQAEFDALKGGVEQHYDQFHGGWRPTGGAG